MATADAHLRSGGVGRPDQAALPARHARHARRCIVATLSVSLAALSVCVAADARMALANWTELWQPLALIAALVAADRYDLPLPARGHRHTGGFTEAVVAFGLFWLPPGCLVAAVAAGMGISQFVTLARPLDRPPSGSSPRARRPVTPAGVVAGVWRAFTVATTTLATSAAAAVALAGTLGAGGGFPRSTLSRTPDLVPVPSARAYLVVVAAMAAYFLVSHTLSSAVVGLLTGSRARRAWREGLPPAGARWSAATAYGLLAVAVVSTEPGLLPVLAVPLAVSAYADRAWSRRLAAAGERRAEQAKDGFVANISHELRTPLTPIKGFLLTLLREDRAIDDDRRRGYYRLMLGQAERLEALVEDLLDVTRLEAGAEVPAAPVDAGQLAAQAVQRARALHPGRAIELRVPAGEVTARGNPRRVGQVLGNLLSNALRYPPEDAPVRVAVAERDGEVVFEVSDSGPGIPPGEQARIFERFHRGGPYLPHDPGGAGLGLYLAKRLVEAMHGRIWVTSHPGHGSTFAFVLPAAGRGEQSSRPARTT